jgi:hypothetical protein
VRYGTQVNFAVEADDLQGHVPDANLTWRINGAAVPGATGPTFTAGLLPVGSHTVTARAVNSAGLVTQQTMTVIVNDDVHYPGPLLAAGPDQVSWHVPAGTTAPQQRTLDVSNAGGGTLSWTATESANWLTLSIVGGTNDGTINLTADAALVPTGEVAATTLIIAGDNGQSVEIPVSLRVGASPAWFPPEPPSGHALYLPLIRRDE